MRKRNTGDDLWVLFGGVCIILLAWIFISYTELIFRVNPFSAETFFSPVNFWIYGLK